MVNKGKSKDLAIGGSSSGKAEILKSIKVEEPYRMRITSGGSISSYVEFAIRFLNDNPHTPLILHTLPLDSSKTNTNTSINSETESSSTNLKFNNFLSCTTNIPRLISVIEIIKRNYINQIRNCNNNSSSSSSKDKIRISKGIWQYNFSDLYYPHINELNIIESNNLERVLNGNLRPKMIHHPYLAITLSTIPLELEKLQKNTTLQYILVKKENRNKKSKGSLIDNEKEEEKENDNDNEIEEISKDRPRITNIVNSIEKSNLKDKKELNSQTFAEVDNPKKIGIKRSSDVERHNSLGKKRKTVK
ncbi:uncharacterized protein I206_104348 [Kwoniella pini CBS 10737]|uniref:Uncharacterized protein n=1 Tax=Kwoniella pini CBS 10737 TaxID=1296096 RepID=A0A1B9I1Y5_9TREE|nr:uncharacterized protein I206_04074 [Kwoniella pini CBS 10737]OCF49552.1 hypothetical protein I206_04074 [Kwoniella pini CBS 10737]